jgi:hypothetical protein
MLEFANVVRIVPGLNAAAAPNIALAWESGDATECQPVS